MDIMAARVILLICCYFACLNASNDVSTPSTTRISSSSALDDLEINKMTTASISPAASDTEATSSPSYNTTAISANVSQSVHTSASPTGTASNTVATTVKPDMNITTTSSNTTMQSIHTTTSGTVTEQQQTTLSEMIPKTTNNTEQGLNKSATSTETGNNPAEEVHHSKEETNSKSFDGRYLWLLVLVVAVLAAGMYLKFKCCKIQHHPVENIDHGTENASFQRTESKDGVMLLGVKSGGEENVAAK